MHMNSVTKKFNTHILYKNKTNLACPLRRMFPMSRPHSYHTLRPSGLVYIFSSLSQSKYFIMY